MRSNLKLYWLVLKYVVLRRRFPLYRIAEDHPEYDDVEIMELFKGASDGPLWDYRSRP